MHFLTLELCWTLFGLDEGGAKSCCLIYLCNSGVKFKCFVQDDFEARLKSQAAKSIAEVERRFRADVVSPAEWEQWVREQQSVAKDVKPGEDVYIILRLDGRVRRSGKGMPDWEALLGELPELDSVLSKLER
jgi:hypothetical protein